MKIIIKAALMMLIVVSLLNLTVIAGAQSGPAPNSGDCIPDGSGF